MNNKKSFNEMAEKAKIEKCSYQLQRYLIGSYEDEKAYNNFLETYKALSPDEQKHVAYETAMFLLKAGYEDKISEANSILETYATKDETHTK